MKSASTIMMLVLGVTIVMVMLLNTVGVHSQHLIGDHVCKHEEKYKVTIEKHSKKNVTQREFVWCMSVPPRCSKYKTVEVDVIKLEEEDRIKEVAKCCEGYKEDNTRTYCIPKCDECVNGNCTAPNFCSCKLGFMGTTCNQTCPKDLWGQNCANKCNCKNAKFCDSFTGYCYCEIGWTGAKCEILMQININSSNISITDIAEKTKDQHGIERKNLTHKLTEVITPSTIGKETTASYMSHPQMEINNNNKPEKTEIKNIIADQERVSTPSVDYMEKSKKNFDGIGKTRQYSVRNSEQWLMDEIKIEDRSSNNDNNYFLVLVISLTVGVAIVLIIISVMSIMIARYKKQRNLAIKHAGIQTNSFTLSNKNRLSNQPIMERSSFHAPLPDPPVFKNAVFSLKEDGNCCKFTTESVHFKTYRGSFAESHYDYPPSSGSYCAASVIPEPGCEPVYDEIPAWRRPKPVTGPTFTPTTRMNFCRHSCCETSVPAATCEWGAMDT